VAQGGGKVFLSPETIPLGPCHMTIDWSVRFDYM
jgi:hypothetical protein